MPNPSNSTGSDNGKANEWAVASTLAEALGCPISIDSTALAAKDKFESLTQNKKQHFLNAAKHSVAHILELEEKTLAIHEPQSIYMPPDSVGQKGDLRDVIVLCDQFAFGISCKTNHEAFKHSRLSDRLNWVKKWGLNPTGCSDAYWQKVRPVFSMLRDLRNQSNRAALFTEIENMHSKVYEPILNAFESEIVRVFNEAVDSEGVCENLVRYLVGTQDFYKIITKPRSVVVHKFNFKGSLAGAKSKLPTKFVGIDRAEGSGHSLNLRLSRGYVFNFRIHSASSRVEPSLKFDIQAIGLPSTEIYRHEIILNNN